MIEKKKITKNIESKVVRASPQKKEIAEAKTTKKIPQMVKLPLENRIRTAEGIKRDMQAKYDKKG